MRHFLPLALLAAVFFGTGASARAEPALQLYLEGATYDAATESWVLTPSAGAPLRLWAIGNANSGTIQDVRLAAAYTADAEFNNDVTITLTPSTTGGYLGFTDTTAPINPVDRGLQPVGSTPRLGPLEEPGDPLSAPTGGYLPSHGIYGSTDTIWREWWLGDLVNNRTLEPNPIADFNGSLAGPNSNSRGQINVYEVAINKGSYQGELHVHFDLYDSILSGNRAKAKFAPFSHDATIDNPPPGGGNGSVVPEPASASLMALGLLGICGVQLRRKMRTAAPQV